MSLSGVRDSVPVEMMLSAKDATSTLALDFIRKYAKSVRQCGFEVVLGVF